MSTSPIIYTEHAPIPEKFYLDKHWRKRCVKNVKQLKALIAELPDSLPIEGWGDEPAEVVVYNHGLHDEHLGFELEPSRNNY